LEHAWSSLVSAPQKVVRDVKSYQVESSFLTSRACQKGLIKDTGVKINKVFGKNLRPTCSSLSPEEQLQSRFALLLEDFNDQEGWTQQWLLDEDACKAFLKTLATIHAYFWTGSNFWKQEDGKLGKELESVVWPNCGCMQPEMQGYDQLRRVAQGWAKKLPSFEKDLKKIEEFSNKIDWKTIGERLEKLAPMVGALSHPFNDGNAVSTAYAKYRTLVHGDPKQANIFLRSRHDAHGLEVGLVDFQWCGFGLAATDVAHHICAAVQPSCVSYDGRKEGKLIDHYYASLSDSLVQCGVASSEEDVQSRVLPREVLQEQFEVALLDICRVVFAYAWDRWKADSIPTSASMNRNAYNKSLPSVLWLIVRCTVLLSKHDKKLAEQPRS
jgi:thiamine kinase-like enzyme